jgi:hypothetical protein
MSDINDDFIVNDDEDEANSISSKGESFGNYNEGIYFFNYLLCSIILTWLGLLIELKN